MKRQLKKRGADDTIGLILVTVFGSIAVASFLATVQAFLAGPDSPAFALGLLTTGVWTGLALIVDGTRPRRTARIRVNRRFY